MEGEEPKTITHINEDRHQGEDIREAEDEQETDNTLDYAIEYRMTGSYPPGLMKDKKRSIQHGDFVQILNTGKEHWVTAASIGAPPVSFVFMIVSTLLLAQPSNHKSRP